VSVDDTDQDADRDDAQDNAAQDAPGAGKSAGDPNAGAEGKELDFSELKRREQQKRQTTKTYILEYEDGARAVFEYQMVDNLSAIADEHTVTRRTRSGQDDEREIDDRYAFARDVLKASLVDAPDGFELSRRALESDITDELMDDLVEAIAEFSSMDEVTRRQFRGLGLRE